MKRGQSEAPVIFTLFEILLVVVFLIASHSLATKTVNTRYPEFEEELNQYTLNYGKEIIGDHLAIDPQQQKNSPSFFQP